MSDSSPAIHPVALDFLLPYLAPHARFVVRPEEADFILAMNSLEPGAAATLTDLRRYGRPLAWWTIEDPNAFESFLAQAAAVDVVFTTDAACLDTYRRQLGHDRVVWLPLACAPELHHPVPVRPDATDFVVSANWYDNEARQWAVETLVEPLVSAGHSLTLFCYETFMWPAPYRQFWRGQRSCLTSADQYSHGRVVLGLNNQRSGMDGRARTYMTSMRTFEALACGKPFLASHSDAYARLGFVNGEHMAWVETPAETRAWSRRLLGPDGDRLAGAGREFVLAHHTYARRLSRIAEAVLG